MGTINYETSDYITLGIKPYDTDDFMKDDDFLDYVKTEYGYTMPDDEDEIYDYIYETISDYTQADYSNAEAILDKYSFYYYHIKLEYGYYEGFYLDIENNFPIAYDDYMEKRDAQKEITQIKNLLIELSENGLCEVYPGWITSYKDHDTTIKSIHEAIKEMRAEAKAIPTWTVYNRACA